MRVEGLFAKEQGSLTDRYIVRSTSVQRGIINDYGNQRTNIQHDTVHPTRKTRGPTCYHDFQRPCNRTPGL